MQLGNAKIIRFRVARRSLDIAILRHLPGFGPFAHSTVLLTDENGNYWQAGHTKGSNQKDKA
jgi:hypothetical protein